MIRSKMIFALVLISTFIALVVIQCTRTVEPVAFHASGAEFAGSLSCQPCHADIYADHLEMAHYSSSANTDYEEIRAELAKGKHSLALNDSISFKIKDLEGMIYQEGYVWDSLIEKKPFHITVGSGKRGKSYLYWEENYLFQLPVSQYAEGSEWVNSPGYPLDRVSFNRAIAPACMECHATYMTGVEDFQRAKKNLFDPSKSIMGITCERCHGPAKAHVDFHHENPYIKTGERIVRYADLTRQQKLDGCALCHSGVRMAVKDPFLFQIGDDLNDFSYGGHSITDAGVLDVHANQYGLLTSSQCFINSPEMDCGTCHDTHKKEVGNLALFSMKCMSCHAHDDQIDCGLSSKMGADIASNCIDCHMPNFTTANITIAKPEGNEDFNTQMRTHRIGIYVENVNKIKEFVSRSESSLIE